MPLHVAAGIDIARVLLEHGAVIDALDVDHESTPAMYHGRDRTQVTRYLMSRGCKTDILMAAAVGDIDVVRELLDADPGVIRTTVSEAYFPMNDPNAGGTIYIWTLGGHKTPHAVARAAYILTSLRAASGPDCLRPSRRCKRPVSS